MDHGKVLPHALARASRQLRSEFLPIPNAVDTLCAQTLGAAVRDFNFDPLMQYLPSLIRGQVKARINLVLTTTATQNMAPVEKWWNGNREIWDGATNLGPRVVSGYKVLFEGSTPAIDAARMRNERIVDGGSSQTNAGAVRLRIAIFRAYYVRTYGRSKRYSGLEELDELDEAVREDGHGVLGSKYAHAVETAVGPGRSLLDRRGSKRQREHNAYAYWSPTQNYEDEDEEIEVMKEDVNEEKHRAVGPKYEKMAHEQWSWVKQWAKKEALQARPLRKAVLATRHSRDLSSYDRAGSRYDDE